MVTFGKDVQPMGEVKIEEQLYSNQFAPTILQLLGMPIAKEIKGQPLKL
jgi:bisphosphoglycerate-independent phosphoglycerate mutase (AlkP superfamily)